MLLPGDIVSLQGMRDCEVAMLILQRGRNYFSYLLSKTFNVAYTIRTIK